MKNLVCNFHHLRRLTYLTEVKSAIKLYSQKQYGMFLFYFFFLYCTLAVNDTGVFLSRNDGTILYSPSQKNNLYINLLKYQMCQRALEDLRFLGKCQETCAWFLETVVVPLDAGPGGTPCDIKRWTPKFRHRNGLYQRTNFPNSCSMKHNEANIPPPQDRSFFLWA